MYIKINTKSILKSKIRGASSKSKARPRNRRRVLEIEGASPRRPIVPIDNADALLFRWGILVQGSRHYSSSRDEVDDRELRHEV